MPDHVFAWLAALLVAVATAVAAGIATRVRLLPEVIDISIVLTGAGLGALAFSAYGALRRFDSDRVARLTLAGTLVGGFGGLLVLVIALLIEVL